MFADSEVSQRTKLGVIFEMSLVLGHCYIIIISLTWKLLDSLPDFTVFTVFLECHWCDPFFVVVVPPLPTFSIVLFLYKDESLIGLFYEL